MKKIKCVHFNTHKVSENLVNLCQSGRGGILQSRATAIPNLEKHRGTERASAVRQQRRTLCRAHQCGSRKGTRLEHKAPFFSLVRSFLLPRSSEHSRGQPKSSAGEPDRLPKTRSRLRSPKALHAPSSRRVATGRLCTVALLEPHNWPAAARLDWVHGCRMWMDLIRNCDVSSTASKSPL